MNKFKSLFILSALALSANAQAQDLNTGYFNDNYLYRHNLNPAFGNEKDYVSMPVLGNLSVGLRGNIGVSDILYKVDGRTALYLNPSVSSEEFDKNIHDKNKLNEELKLQIMSAGFKSFGGYSTIDINVREGLNACIPGSILRATKDGLTNQTYDFSNLSADANAFAEIALGHSHRINDNLRIGAKLKFLLGIANVSMNFNKAMLDLNKDNYTATVDAEVQVNTTSLDFKHEVNSRTNHEYVNGIGEKKFGLNGFGIAGDLGAEYTLKDWDFSLAIVDLGFVRYGKTFTASTDGEKSIQTDKYSFNVDGDASNSFENEGNKLKDDLSALYELNDKGDTGSKSVGLGTTLNFGAKYTLPSYDRLSFGLTNSTRFGKYSWTDFRLGVNIRPVNAIAVSANVSAGTYGVGFGWLIDLQAKHGIDFFLGMDRTPGKLAKQGIPLSSNMQFSMGLNFPL